MLYQAKMNKIKNKLVNFKGSSFDAKIALFMPNQN